MMEDNQPNVNQKTRSRTRRLNILLATASVVVAVILLSVLLWPGGDDEGDLFSLNQIEGGFVCEIQRDSSSWSRVYVWVDDGDYSGFFALGNDILEAGQWAIADYGEVQVNTLTLSLFVIDVKGDGEMGRGDSIIVTAVNSTGFSSDVAYRFVMWIGNLAISGTEYSMDFRFVDGTLVTDDLETKWYPA
jgi:hypothetical protein